MARVNELLREILGDTLERLDDDRTALVTVTAVSCDPDLRHATVYLDTLAGPEEDDALLEALGELRPRLQAAIAREARLKRTPELTFSPDLVVRTAGRIEEVLRGLDDLSDD
jgi:ribosome-binding factor A